MKKKRHIRSFAILYAIITDIIFKKRIYKCAPTARIIPILLHEQAVCRRGTKKQKAYLIRMVKDNNRALLFTSISTFQRPEVKNIKDGFLKLSCDLLNGLYWKGKLSKGYNFVLYLYKGFSSKFL